jgi:hypothetical protein
MSLTLAGTGNRQVQNCPKLIFYSISAEVPHFSGVVVLKIA